MHHTLSSYICALVSLAGLSPCMRIAQSSDIKLSRLRNPNLSPEQIAHINDLTKERGSALRSKTLLSFLWIFSAVVTAYLGLLQFSGTTSLTLQQVFSAASVFTFAWATLGRLSWLELSHKGITIFERLDVFLFWTQYWLGTLFGVIALSGV